MIDHDVQSNYGSWHFASGLGPGKILFFNTLTQSVRFDTGGEFIRLWCPELANVPTTYIHDPWNMPPDVANECGVSIVPYTAGMGPSKHYPSPINCAKYTSAEAAKQIARAYGGKKVVR